MSSEAQIPLSENKKLSPNQLQNQRFIDTNSESLDSIFAAIGAEVRTTDPITDVVAKTQLWAKGDHHDGQAVFTLTDGMQRQFLDTFAEIGMLSEVMPEGGEYDQILILGGEQRSNHARIDYLENLLQEKKVWLADDGAIVSLGGKRPLKGREIIDIAHDLSVLEDSESPWLGKIKKAEMGYSLEEDAAMRLALMARFAGDAVLNRMHIRLGHADPISHREMISADGSNKLVFINAPAVERPLGPARHTTESTLQEWLALYPPKTGARILFVSNNPYILRTARNAATALHGRQDVSLDYCGAPAVIDKSIVNRCMGEIARNIYEDQSI